MMLRASLIGFWVTIGLNLVLVLFGGALSPLLVIGLIPGFVGGSLAGLIANRGPLGGLVAGTIITVLMFFPMLAILTGVAPSNYELMGEFPGVSKFILNIAPTAASVLVGGSIGGLLREMLPRWRTGREKSRSAAVQSSYYKK